MEQRIRLRTGWVCALMGWLCLGACQGQPKREKPSLEAVRAQQVARQPMGASETQAVDLEQPTDRPSAQSASADSSSADSLGPDSPGSVDQDPIVARAAGLTIRAGDLLGSWMFRDSEAVRELLDRLVLDRLAQAEAARLGVRLDPAMVAQDWARTLADFDDEIAKAEPTMGREEFVRARLGFDPPTYFAMMAERRHLDLLAARCVRGYFLESERIEARLLVAPDRQSADRVEAGLAQGRPFADLAREFSVDPTASQGGRIPPVVRSRASIARLVFATPLGEVGGPLKERGRFLYVLPESHREGLRETWSVLGPQVEASLVERPIEDLEFIQWQAMVLERYEVDTRPLLRWIGQGQAE